MDNEKLVQTKLFEQLVSQAYPLVFIFPFTAFFASFFLIDVAPSIYLVLWCCLAVVQSLLRYLFTRRFLKHDKTEQDFSTWTNKYQLLELSGGIISGMTGIMFSSITYEYQLVLLLFLVIQFAGATAMFAPVLRIYYSFSFSAAPIMIFWLLYQNNTQLTMSAILFSACTVLFISATKKLNSAITNSMTLQFENQALIEEIVCNNEELKVAKDEAEKANRAKSTFLANISHELRTPMHGILSFAKLGVEKHKTLPREKLETYFSQIATSGNRLLLLLNDLLDLAKLEAGKMSFNIQKGDLLPLIHHCVNDYSSLLSQKSIRIEIISPDIHLGIDTHVMLDEAKILQVLHNLLSNAIKYSGEGKIIQIEFVETTLEMNDSQSTMAGEPAVKVCVIDAGPGIPENELNSIFDKFVQSSQTKTGVSGSGLGLAIVREIIEGHKGTISAANCPRGGAMFCFTLPRNNINE